MAIIAKAGITAMFWNLFLLPVVVLADEASRYLFASSSRTGKVVYVHLPARSPITGPGAPEHVVHTLIDSGLKAPMGLASDQQRGRLFVADPEAKKILSYKILFSAGKAVVDGEASVAANDVEARWVACDGIGNLFVSDEARNYIMKIPADGSFRRDSLTSSSASVVYSGNVLTQVSAPGGVAVDNFHIFWSNKAVGTTAGSVVKGFETPPSTNAAESVLVLANNADKVYGVCLAKDNVFYTNHERYIYGVKKGGGTELTISDKFQEPRGCSWDGDGTVFVADRGANLIAAFAGNMQKLAPARVGKVIDLEGAFGVAVLSDATGALSHAKTLLLIMLVSAFLS
jgi:hypothetical protein